MRSLLVASLMSVLALSAFGCKSETTTSGGAAAKGGEAGGADVYKAYLQDKFMLKGAELKAKYPEGKPFEMKAKVLEAGGCGAAQCGLSLGLASGEEGMMLWGFAPDQKQIEGLKAGAIVTIKCTPVYEGDKIDEAKSCTVAAN